MSDSHALERAHKILIISIVLLLSAVVIFVSFLHLWWFWYHREQNLATRPRRGDFTAGQPSGITVLRRGLNPSFLKTIPVTPLDRKEGLECVVCLSEVGEGEETRILPKCGHRFHVECIDMWFYSHSTCPICRNPVSTGTEISVENLQEEEEGGDHFPTNILFWGDETEVSTLTSQLHISTSSSSQPVTTRPDLAIDIPTRIDCDEDHKSPAVEQGTRGHL